MKESEIKMLFTEYNGAAFSAATAYVKLDGEDKLRQESSSFAKKCLIERLLKEYDLEWLEKD